VGGMCAQSPKSDTEVLLGSLDVPEKSFIFGIPW